MQNSSTFHLQVLFISTLSRTEKFWFTAEVGHSATEAAFSGAASSGEAKAARSGPEEAVGEEGFKPSTIKLCCNFLKSF
jgi:hypothetical protein